MLSPQRFRELVSGQRRGPTASIARGLLSIAEWPYRCGVAQRNRRYDRSPEAVTKVSVPVVSVGNLTLGGTGKTPMVAWLAQWFRQHRVRVSIVSRGYGAGPNAVNDEALELEARLPDVPHVQDRDRIAAAGIAIEELETQLILLDDGFQHRRLHRDLDLVLIDATEPFGFEHVFPRGLLREPPQNLARADAIAITRCNLVPPERLEQIDKRLQRYAPGIPRIRVGHQTDRLLTASGQLVNLADRDLKRVAAFCAIGNPAAFRQTLVEAGLEVVKFQEFPDHHLFIADDLATLRDWLDDGEPVDAAVCTHKDLVKINCDQIGMTPLMALMIQVQILEGHATCEAMLREVLALIPDE